eukprot:JP435719.1.p4 GENE.JP435719.1~~JP435719.1.p4  ORF type:complete len:67 (+),score=4.72 JP435719.1:810-1010(+)
MGRLSEWDCGGDADGVGDGESTSWDVFSSKNGSCSSSSPSCGMQFPPCGDNTGNDGDEGGERFKER